MEGIDPGLVAMLKDNGGKKDDNSMLILLLLLLGGRRGLGGLGGEDGVAAANCCPPATLEQLNDAQNAIQSGQVALSNRVGDQTTNIIRDIGDSSARNDAGQSRICEAVSNSNSANLMGQTTITAAIADCCCQNLLSQKDTQKEICETRNAINVGALATQNAIEKCCCEIGNGMAMQTSVLGQAICNDGDKTRALITSIERDQLQAQLTDQKLANSNLNQTVQLTEQIRNACCQPCQPCGDGHHGGGGRGAGTS